MISNRQSSRRRGRGGSQRPTGGSSSQGQRDSGNRIDSRTRGNAAQLLEKYRNMARDAQMSGDRVNTEYYLQFADHYFRVLSDSRARQDDHRPIRAVDDFDAIEEYGEEGEPIRSSEQGGYDAPRGNGQDSRQDGRQDARQDGRDYQPREDRQSRDDRQPRDDRQREATQRDGNREDRPREDRQRRDYRDQRPQSRDGQSRDAQPRGNQPRDGQPREPQPVEAEAEERTAEQSAAQAEAPYRNGAANDVEAAPKPERKPRTRTPRAPVAVAPEMEVASMDEDRLPPSLGIVGEAVAESEAPKPKRKPRTPRAAPTEAQAG